MKPWLVGKEATVGCFLDTQFEKILARLCGQTTPTAARGSSDCSGTSLVRVDVVGLALGDFKCTEQLVLLVDGLMLSLCFLSYSSDVRAGTICLVAAVVFGCCFGFIELLVSSSLLPCGIIRSSIFVSLFIAGYSS